MGRSRHLAPSRCDRGFANAVELFNAGRYFESHEVLERIWLRAEGTEKLFLQGLIQAAAALLHLERGNQRGVRSLYRKAQARLEAVPDLLMGLDVAEFRAALKSFILVALDGGPAITPPQLHRAEPPRK